MARGSVLGGAKDVVHAQRSAGATAFVLSAAIALCLLCGRALGAERYALIVGIDRYLNFSEQMQLHGCENDARWVQSELTKRYGFQPSNIKMLLSAAATRDAILQGLEWLNSASKQGDVCLFYYSGHGSQLPSSSPTEEDRLDEILCPTNIKLTSATGGENYIRDKEMSAIAKRFAGKQFTAVFDCCHSGTGLRSLVRAVGGKYLFYEGPPPAAQGGGARSLGQSGDLDNLFFAQADGGVSAGRGASGKTRSIFGMGAGAGGAEATSPGTRALGDGSGVQDAALIAAARSDELASESEPTVVDGQTRVHGCLTLKLMQGLRGEADINHDKKITFAELHDFLGTKPLVTPRSVQHPQIEVDGAMKDRGIFDTRDIAFEPAGATPPGATASASAWQPAAPAGQPAVPAWQSAVPAGQPAAAPLAPGAAPNPTGAYPPTGGGPGGIMPLTVAFAVASELAAPGPAYDAAGAAAARQALEGAISADAGAFRVVPSTAAYEAIIVCGARRGSGGVEFETAVIDGSATVQFRQKAANPAGLAEGVRQTLQRMRTVRNLLRLSQPPASPYRVAVQLDGGGSRLRLGEKMRIVCQPNRDGYLTIINVNPAGGIALLYPNSWSGGLAGWKAQGGESVAIPSPQMNFDIEVEEPLGNEFVIAFLTPEAMDLQGLGLDPNAKGQFSEAKNSGNTANSVVESLSRSLGGDKDERALKAKQKSQAPGAPQPQALPSGAFSPLSSTDWAVATLDFLTSK